ncbi:MAG: hypothetical protein QXO30_05735 [Candidatus Caldarchaeum sp.]
MTVHVSGWAEDLLERYFGQCGLLEEARKQIEGLPRELSERLGRDVSFWENVLSNPGSNLLEWAIEKVVRQAEENERRFGKSLCHYLVEALYNHSIANWIAGYVSFVIDLAEEDPSKT